jgi:hypothetical protein
MKSVNAHLWVYAKGEQRAFVLILKCASWMFGGARASELARRSQDHIRSRLSGIYTAGQEFN